VKRLEVGQSAISPATFENNDRSEKNFKACFLIRCENDGGIPIGFKIACKAHIEKIFNLLGLGATYIHLMAERRNRKCHP